MNKKQSNWNRNPKHVYYVSLLNSKEWQGINGLRARTLRAHPLCQLCEKQGLVVSAVDVHHLKPVEGVGGRYQDGDVLPDSARVDSLRALVGYKGVTLTEDGRLVKSNPGIVMDFSAICMCQDNNLPIYVFNMDVVGNLMRVMQGEDIGTLVHP